jgi:hypothetical protein
LAGSSLLLASFVGGWIASKLAVFLCALLLGWLILNHLHLFGRAIVVGGIILLTYRKHG